MCLFFFFKQKTAYEIKECDWSSDVCSSDLNVNLSATVKNIGKNTASSFIFNLYNDVNNDNIGKIGRASCRERV